MPSQSSNTTFEPGNSLRQARLRRGLELTHVEARIGVRTKYLRALEWGRLDLMPDDQAARKILRAYAEHLNLDPEPYLDAYGVRAPALKQPAPQSGGRRWRPPESEVLAALVPIVPAAIAVAIVFLFVGGSPGKGGVEGSAPPAASPRGSGHAPRVERARGRNRVPPPSSSSAITPARARLEVIASRGDSWVVVRAGSARGRVLFAGTLLKGRSLRLEDRRLWVRLGAASNLDVRVNGARLGVALYGTLDALLTAAGFRKVPFR